MSNILPLPQPTLRLSAWGVLRETRSRSGKSQAVANRTMTSSHSPSDNEVSKSSHGRLHGTLLGVAIEGPGPCPLYWLVYRHNNQISVVIEPGASLIHARLRASLAKLDEGEFTEGQSASLPRLGQADDLMSVDTEDYLLPTRQLDDEF